LIENETKQSNLKYIITNNSYLHLYTSMYTSYYLIYGKKWKRWFASTIGGVLNSIDNFFEEKNYKVSTSGWKLFEKRLLSRNTTYKTMYNNAFNTFMYYSQLYVFCKLFHCSLFVVDIGLKLLLYRCWSTTKET